jgi:Ca2+-binding RTX toxin-like protein
MAILSNITDNSNRVLFKDLFAGDDYLDSTTTGGGDRIHGWAGRDTIYADFGDSIRGDGVGAPFDPDLPDNDAVNFADSIAAGGGNDSIWGGGGADTILGGPGDDKLFGQGGADSIVGGEDNDAIIGGEGDDLCQGGAGNDWIAGGPGANRIFGDDGNDKLYAFAPASEAERWGWVDAGEPDYVYGGAGNDTIIGSADGTRGGLSGDDGDDLIISGPNGADASGGDGNDRMLGGDGFDVFLGGPGNDTLKGGEHGDVLDDREGDNYIDGGEGDDHISANVGTNITSTSGNNTIVAGGGNDVITLSDVIGSNDFVHGGRGDDVYHVSINPVGRVQDLIRIGSDVIADFVKGDDRLQIGGTGFNPPVQSFDDLDTNGSGFLDAGDDYVRIADGTVLDFSALYGQSPGSEMITFLGVTGLSAQDVL